MTKIKKKAVKPETSKAKEDEAATDLRLPLGAQERLFDLAEMINEENRKLRAENRVFTGAPDTDGKIQMPPPVECVVKEETFCSGCGKPLTVRAIEERAVPTTVVSLSNFRNTRSGCCNLPVTVTLSLEDPKFAFDPRRYTRRSES